MMKICGKKVVTQTRQMYQFGRAAQHIFASEGVCSGKWHSCVLIHGCGKQCQLDCPRLMAHLRLSAEDTKSCFGCRWPEMETWINLQTNWISAMLGACAAQTMRECSLLGVPHQQIAGSILLNLPEFWKANNSCTLHGFQTSCLS